MPGSHQFCLTLQLYARRVDQSEGADMITASANNFYEGVTQAEVEKYYALSSRSC
ncbi:MAG: hypothetical protein MZV63_09175 [Marinilabiliales bacterium]|nr:hypothetical protein [Marinilabiliales bacterium]